MKKTNQQAVNSQSAGIKVKTKVKAGGPLIQHNQSAAPLPKARRATR